MDSKYFWTSSLTQKRSGPKADQVAKRTLPPGSYYCRYMDDLVLLGKGKSGVLDATAAVVDHAQRQLKLKIPFQKRVPLGNDPIPFLGFVVHHDGYRILSRNNKRRVKHDRVLTASGTRPSRIAQAGNSFESWKNLDQGRMRL